MKIIIIGGCGYTGSVLTKDLITQGHKVLVLDTQWFGNPLKKVKNLYLKKVDIRSLKNISFKGYDSIIHLANIANDPSVELNPGLSWEVNVLSTKQILEKAINDKVKHFIYASSGSVYGVKKERKVTENLQLIPISIYNKTKMIAERVIMSYKNQIKFHIIRPATVCGPSLNMRLDLTVNMFVSQALQNKCITVFGGNQIRPNIHLLDLIRVYKYFLFKPYLKQGIYNAGFENLSLIKIARKVQKIIDCKIKIKKNYDIRSYRQNSDKLLSIGFKPKHNVDDAILQLKNYFNNKIKKSYYQKKYFRVQQMKFLKIN